MNILDIILLICFVPAIIQGLRKGFITQAISLVSIIFGVWASARFSAVVSSWVAQYISVSDQALKIISFAMILIAVFVILGLIGKLLEGVFNLVMLGWLNRVLGLVFALFKAFVIVGLLIMVFNSLNDTFEIVKPSVMKESVLYPYINKAANDIFPYIKDLLKK